MQRLTQTLERLWNKQHENNHQLNLWQCFPYVALLAWTGLLLVASNGQQSLLAHDEGWYATQARWIVQTGDWVTPQWWSEPVYDRTIGIQWLIALCYQLFGISDGVARLPSLVACLLAIMLTYAIGKRLLAASIAWMGAAILPLCSLWLQYGRMAVQDIVLTCLELLGIWALLQAETSDRRRLVWGMVAGTTVGLGFLIKSIMIVLPIVALSPYLLHHHRHFRNPGLYLGVVIGFLPVSLWLWLSYQRYGLMPFQQLFGHLFMLGSKQFHADAGLLYYFWNIPLNAFPWALLALVGIGVVGYQLLVSHPSPLVIGHWLLGVQRIKDNRQITNHEGQTLPRISLLLYPLILFAALTVFSTRTPYYALQLYPFVGLFAAVALVWLANQAKSGITLVVSYGVGGLAIVLLIMGLLAIAGMIPIPVEFRVYGVLLCILGGGWLLLPWLWQRKQLRQWLAIWLLAPWLTLAVAGVVGLWGNYNPDVKATLASAQLSSVLQHHAVSVVVHDLQPEEHKTWVLLSFYTPQLGRSLPSLSALPVGSYAWVSPRVAIEPAEGYQVVASLRNWRLVLCKLNLTGNQPPGS